MLKRRSLPSGCGVESLHRDKATHIIYYNAKVIKNTDYAIKEYASLF